MARLDLSIAGVALALALGLAPAFGAGLAAGKSLAAARALTEQAQYAYNSRGFRRCMRAKYGSRYFARVPRAHRWHMSQACMA